MFGKPKLYIFILVAIFSLAGEASQRGDLSGPLCLSKVKTILEKPLYSRPTELQRDLQRRGFGKAVLNKDILRAHNRRYTFELPQVSIVDQENSGNCWIFGCFSLIRTHLYNNKTISKNYRFSESYIYYFSILEEAHEYLSKISLQRLENPESSPKSFDWRTKGPDMGDGGSSNKVLYLIDKYGLVPQKAMPPTASFRSTDLLQREIEHVLGVATSKMFGIDPGFGGNFDSKLLEAREEALREVIAVLNAHLGVPPLNREVHFTERGGRVRHYRSPQEFAQALFAFNSNDFIAVGSNPLRPKNSLFLYPTDLEAVGNVHFLNLERARIKEMIIASLHAGIPVAVAIDQRLRWEETKGIFHPDIFEGNRSYRDPISEISPKEEVLYRLTKPNHLVILTGYDQPVSGGPIVKWKVVNSWGISQGDKGIFHMYDEWLDRYVFQFFVPRFVLSAEEKKVAEGNPTAVIGVGERFF